MTKGRPYDHYTEGAELRADLRRRLEKIARTTPAVAREVPRVEAILDIGNLDDLPPEWCRRLGLPANGENKGKVLVALRTVSGPDGEPLTEIDRVVFDEQLKEGAPGGEIWLEVALVHPPESKSQYRCSISTRFALSDARVAKAVAEVQSRWAERFGAHFFQSGEVKPYIVNPESGQATRAYGARSRFAIAEDAHRVYGRLDVIARAWDAHANEPAAKSTTIKQYIIEKIPLAADLFLDGSDPQSVEAEPLFEDEDAEPDWGQHPRIELVRRVGLALGYLRDSGERLCKEPKRPDEGEIDRRLLGLVAKILAQMHGRPASTLLRTVVRPALLRDDFAGGFIIESSERAVRSTSKGIRGSKHSAENPNIRPDEKKK